MPSVICGGIHSAWPCQRLNSSTPKCLQANGKELILIFLRRICEDHACDFVREFSVKNAHIVTSERVTHQNIRRVFPSILQKRVQFARNLQTCSWEWSGIALPVTSTVIG